MHSSVSVCLGVLSYFSSCNWPQAFKEWPGRIAKCDSNPTEMSREIRTASNGIGMVGTPSQWIMLVPGLGQVQGKNYAWATLKINQPPIAAATSVWLQAASVFSLPPVSKRKKKAGDSSGLQSGKRTRSPSQLPPPPHPTQKCWRHLTHQAIFLFLALPLNFKIQVQNRTAARKPFSGCGIVFLPDYLFYCLVQLCFKAQSSRVKMER